MDVTLGKTEWRSSEKLKIELAYDPAMLLLSINPKELKAGFGRDICTSMFIALFTKTKN